MLATAAANFATKLQISLLRRSGSDHRHAGDGSGPLRGETTAPSHICSPGRADSADQYAGDDGEAAGSLSDLLFRMSRFGRSACLLSEENKVLD